MEDINGKQKIEEVTRVLLEEVARLRAQRLDISNRLARMNQIILRLRDLNGSGTDRPSINTGKRLGITRACRLVLMQSQERPLTIGEVFRAVQARLPAMLAHKDPRASVATILGRLVEYGEVDVITDDKRKRAYRWIHQDSVARQSYESVMPNHSQLDPGSDRYAMDVP